MRKFGLMLFPVTFLGWLLALIPAPATAYYPPLQATGNFTSNSIHVTVYDPRLQKEQGFFRLIRGASVEIVDWRQQSGVISWTKRDGSAYYVTCCVYDPDSATFKEDQQGPFSSVSSLQVRDGVVAYVAGIPPDSGHAEFRYATYDSVRQGWQRASWYQAGMQILGISTQDGVVLSQFFLYGVYWFNVHMYDPMDGSWPPGMGIYNGSPFLSITISNATVTYEAYSNGVTVSDKFGFLMGPGKGWFMGQDTPAQAYFVAQPTSGPSPLWVWFTDMSIAGTVWNWNFGDNSGSTSRSPYHTFISRGNYNVSQQLNMPSAAYNRTINVGSKKISGGLNLLLLTN